MEEERKTLIYMYSGTDWSFRQDIPESVHGDKGARVKCGLPIGGANAQYRL